MKILIGNFRGRDGIPGEKGEPGAKGEPGDKGQRGSRWTSGTAITGTSTVGVRFPDSGLVDAQIYDHYVNTDTCNMYECVVPGTPDEAEWVHIGSLGNISNINSQRPSYEEALQFENLKSGETIGTAFGKIKKAIAEIKNHFTRKSDATVMGHVKLSDSAAITVAGEYALDAREKNASISSTLAGQISRLNHDVKERIIFEPSESQIDSMKGCEKYIVDAITETGSWSTDYKQGYKTAIVLGKGYGPGPEPKFMPLGKYMQIGMRLGITMYDAVLGKVMTVLNSDIAAVYGGNYHILSMQAQYPSALYVYMNTIYIVSRGAGVFPGDADGGGWITCTIENNNPSNNNPRITVYGIYADASGTLKRHKYNVVHELSGGNPTITSLTI